MRAKSILVSFLAVLAVFLLAANASASLVNSDGIQVWINGHNADAKNIAVFPGENLHVAVGFTAGETTELGDPVKVSVEIKGYGDNIEAERTVGRLYEGKFYKERFNLNIPFDLFDDLEDDTVRLEVEISDGETVQKTIELFVEREAYSLKILSVDAPQTIEAGSIVPVEVVLRNQGTEKLDDLFITVSIPELGIEKKVFADELVELEDNYNDDDEEDTIAKVIRIPVPEDVESGLYSLEVKASNRDTSASKTEKVFIKSAETEIFATSKTKSFAVGEEAVYEILVVNPTNSVKVFRIVPETAENLNIKVSESLIAVSAGDSRTVRISVTADEEGTYNFGVNVLSGDEVVERKALSANVEGRTIANPVVALTVVLAIIFVVLLIVLIVLLSRKPAKAEEFGESYY